MTNTEIRTSYVKVSNGDLQIDAYLAEPIKQGTFPAVIVIQEIFGVNIHIREVTQKLAKESYVAMSTTGYANAPTLYQRTVPGFEAGYTAEDIQRGRGYKEQTKAAEILSKIQAAIAYLKNLANVQPDEIGSIGFCFDGHVVYLAATLPDIKATASFYGGGTPNSTPGSSEPTITRTPDIKGQIYSFFGKEDQGIPLEQTKQIEAELKKYQISHKVFRCDGAGQGFFCNHRANYNAEAAADAWTQVTELFQKTLQLQTV